MKIAAPLKAIICLITTFAVAGIRADEIRMATSDLLAEFITPSLIAMAERDGLELKIDAIGSLPAMDRLNADEIDLAIMAFPEDSVVPRDKFRVYPFAYDAAVVAVNETNPINDLSIPQLAGIFGSNEELNFKTWGDLGLSGWSSRNIKALAGPADNSISMELFRYTVLSGGLMKPGVDVLRPGEIEDALASNTSSIGILSSLPKSDRLKVLMVSLDDGAESPAYGPTEDNIHLGDYPIRLGFYLVYNPRDENKLKPLLRELLGSELADVLRENRFFPLPEPIRNQFILGLDLGQ